MTIFVGHVELGGLHFIIIPSQFRGRDCLTKFSKSARAHGSLSVAKFSLNLGQMGITTAYFPLLSRSPSSFAAQIEQSLHNTPRACEYRQSSRATNHHKVRYSPPINEANETHPSNLNEILSTLSSSSIPNHSNPGTQRSQSRKRSTHQIQSLPNLQQPENLFLPNPHQHLFFPSLRQPLQRPVCLSHCS